MRRKVNEKNFCSLDSPPWIKDDLAWVGWWASSLQGIYRDRGSIEEYLNHRQPGWLRMVYNGLHGISRHCSMKIDPRCSGDIVPDYKNGIQIAL